MAKVEISRQLDRKSFIFELRRLFGPKIAVNEILNDVKKTPFVHYESTYRHRCVQKNTFTAIFHKGKWVYRQVVDSKWFKENEWPKPVFSRQCHTMFLGMKDSPDYVIKSGLLLHNVGIGWIQKRVAEESDYYEHSTVEETR